MKSESEPEILSRPIRLLLAVDSLDAGGAERHVVDLAAELTRRGYDVTIACSVSGVLSTEVEEAGVRVRPLVNRLVKRRVSARFATKLRILLRQGRFDLVHGHVYASAVAAALATLGTGIPLVVTEHTEGPWRSPAARWFSRWIYGRTARLIVVSQAIRSLLLSEYGVPGSRIAFVAPAVTPIGPHHPPPARPLPDEWMRAPLIGRVGRLQPEKGVDVFLRAAAAVCPLVPDAHFLVIGEGPLRRRLQALADDLGLTDRVHFLGFRPDARSLIELLDVLVVSSHSDGAPLVVLEAMSAEVPVVASAVGGIPDLVRHERDGLLFPPGDHAALADALLRLMADIATARRMAEAGRRRAEELGHGRMVDEIETVYSEVLAPAPVVSLRGTPASRSTSRLRP